jgi:hypothetical protein
MKKITILICAFILLGVAWWAQARTVMVVTGGVAAAPPTGGTSLDDFEGGSNGNEIGSPWSLTTNGSVAMTYSNSGAQGGALCASMSCDPDNWSGYTQTISQTQQYYLITLYLYVTSGSASTTTWYPFVIYGNSGASSITFAQVIQGASDCQFFLFGAGDFQQVDNLANNSWNKVEIQLNSTANQWTVSVNDGAASTAYGYQNNYAADRFMIRNNGSITTTMKIDTITIQDGGTL